MMLATGMRHLCCKESGQWGGGAASEAETLGVGNEIN